MGVNWVQGILGGVAAVFAGIMTYSAKVFVDNCSAEFLAVAGLIPYEGELAVAACAGVAGLWAISAFITSIAGIGGWNYNSGSASANARRAVFDERHVLNGTEIVVRVNNVIHDNFNDLVSAYAPTTGHMITNVFKMGHANVSDDDCFHAFISDNHFGKVSVLAYGEEALHDALKTHEVCMNGGNCTSAPSLTKRSSSDSGWASYTDWGTNYGYDQDWKNWNYDYLVPHDYAIMVGDAIVSQTQGCTNSDYCFAMDAKYCLSAGYSQTRTQDSVAVGEVYNGAYGGVDGECMNG